MTRPLPTGPLADALARFPLTPGSGPQTALSLEQRVEKLVDLARRAADRADAALAGEVHRRTARLHYDLGLPGTAYTVCNLHTSLLLQHWPLSVELARCALELQLTHADLLVRAGQPATAVALLEAILRAIGTDRDAEAAAVGTLPMAHLVETVQERGDLYEWWENASLLPLAQALVRDGDWARARLALMADPTPPPGPGAARQIETIALALAGQHQIAATRLARIRLDRQTPWEHVVAAALTTACTLLGEHADMGLLTDRLTALADAHDTYEPTGSPEFDTQLTLACVDLSTAADTPALAERFYEIAAHWALEHPDGYSARALLGHDLAARLPDGHREELAATVDRAGLAAAVLPPHLDDQVTGALVLATQAITAATAPPPGP
ncbi:hypothetical protein ACFV6F_32260 [Kitasatospora phosalacinea]|uniref:hypothetical protein n=1 Tax=Kitasatospora phosalacinea TaxID=2065 RepID=UPI00366376E7